MSLPSGYVAHDSVVTMHGRKVSLTSLCHVTWALPVAADDNGIQTTKAGPNATTVHYYASDSTLLGALVSGGQCQFDYPRSVTVTVTHSTSIVACSGVIYGTDFDDKPISEAWSVTATGTSKTYVTGKCFKSITQVSVTAAGNASANSIIVGTNDTLGLPVKCSMVTIVGEALEGVTPTAGALVKGVAASATKDPLGTYTPNAALDVTKTYEVVYITDDPQNS